jgi:hypothetical protein
MQRLPLQAAKRQAFHANLPSRLAGSGGPFLSRYDCDGKMPSVTGKLLEIPGARFPPDLAETSFCYSKDCALSLQRGRMAEFLRSLSMRENAMQRTIFTAIILLGIGATAQAQTAAGTIGTDPLSVPTSTLPSSSSFSSGTSTAESSSSGTTVNGSVATSGAATGSTSGIGASSSRSSQVPLELPGEGLDSSTQAASSTAVAPAAPSPICPPSIPTTDGGSDNLTVIDGFSPGGC